MGKLHQLLAVESDLDHSYKNALEETKIVFEKKTNLFFGSIKSLKIFDESDTTRYSDERHEITTTVPKRLGYQSSFIENYLDALLQKEATNQIAMANLIVNGVTIAEDLPATFLLALEKRLVTIRAVYKSIPTLPQGTSWNIDPTLGQDIFKTMYPDVKFKTKKTFNHKVLYEATKEHPAQIEKWDETENVGEYSIDTWCGLIPSADKAIILKRFDDVIIAVKKARQKANNCDVI